jgi:hypothetical protein
MINEKIIKILHLPPITSRFRDILRHYRSSRRQPGDPPLASLPGPLQISFASFVSSSCMSRSCVLEPAVRSALVVRSHTNTPSLPTNCCMQPAMLANFSGACLLCFCCHGAGLVGKDAGDCKTACQSQARWRRGLAGSCGARKSRARDRRPIHALSHGRQPTAAKLPLRLQPPTPYLTSPPPWTWPCLSSKSPSFNSTPPPSSA